MAEQHQPHATEFAHGGGDLPILWEDLFDIELPPREANPLEYEIWRHERLMRRLDRQHRASTILTCSGCEDNFAGYQLSQLICKHEYCRDCLAAMFTVSLDDGAVFPPHCCGESVSLNLADTHGLGNTDAIYAKKKRLDAEKHLVRCHDPECATPLDNGRAFKPVCTCSTCGKKTCMICQAGEHADICPQDRLLQELNVNLGQRKWQRCFQCCRVVEKTSGCDMMTCPCGAHFCYRCAAESSYGKPCACHPVAIPNLRYQIPGALNLWQPHLPEGQRPAGAAQGALPRERLELYEHDVERNFRDHRRRLRELQERYGRAIEGWGNVLHETEPLLRREARPRDNPLDLGARIRATAQQIQRQNARLRATIRGIQPAVDQPPRPPAPRSVHHTHFPDVWGQSDQPAPRRYGEPLRPIYDNTDSQLHYWNLPAEQSAHQPTWADMQPQATEWFPSDNAGHQVPRLDPPRQDYREPFFQGTAAIPTVDTARRDLLRALQHTTTLPNTAHNQPQRSLRDHLRNRRAHRTSVEHVRQWLESAPEFDKLAQQDMPSERQTVHMHYAPEPIQRRVQLQDTRFIHYRPDQTRPRRRLPAANRHVGTPFDNPDRSGEPDVQRPAQGPHTLRDPWRY